MLFFYIRHGDPIYEPDSLTELGLKQADALAKRLALFGLDRIYASSSNRAILTAKPTCDLLNKDMEILDFANEHYTRQEFDIVRDGKSRWLYQDEEARLLFADEAILSLGQNWYEHPEMRAYQKGIERIRREAKQFFMGLGYEHIENSGKYKVIKPSDERVAFFAHHGFGMAFLSVILGIPYPRFANHFDMTHTGMTVIEFKEEMGYAIPRVLTLSSDSHLYSEGMPTKYNNRLFF